MTPDWASCPDVESDPEKLGGTWVLRNTRMPVSLIFEVIAPYTLQILEPVLRGVI